MKNNSGKTKTNAVNHSPIISILSVVSIGYFLYYLWWRVTHTLNPDYPSSILDVIDR